jgi:hypothetical protein
MPRSVLGLLDPRLRGDDDWEIIGKNLSAVLVLLLSRPQGSVFSFFWSRRRRVNVGLLAVGGDANPPICARRVFRVRGLLIRLRPRAKRSILVPRFPLGTLPPPPSFPLTSSALIQPLTTSHFPRYTHRSTWAGPLGTPQKNFAPYPPTTYNASPLKIPPLHAPFGAE